MATKVYTPSEAATLIGVSASTVRDWAQRFPNHLSEDANPPKGVARVFTARDVGLLQKVAELRATYKGYPEIETELAALPVEEEIEPYIDVAPTPPTNALEAAQPADMALQVVTMVNASLAALGERMTQLEKARVEEKKENASRIWFVLAGMGIGILLTLAAIFGLQSGAWFGS